jgi:hypothetical protein
MGVSLETRPVRASDNDGQTVRKSQEGRRIANGSGSLLRTAWLRNGNVPGNQEPVRGHECHGTHSREHDDEVPAPEHR